MREMRLVAVRLAGALILAAVHGLPGSLEGQTASAGPRQLDGVRSAPMSEAVAVDLPRKPGSPSPIRAALASLLVPGTGQLRMGQERWAAYAGMELVGVLVELDQVRAGRNARAAYRELAWTVARAMPHARTDGRWAYYAAMSYYRSSGAFDVDVARAGVQPETDLRTANGAVWKSAYELYVAWPRQRGQAVDPAGALGFYELRATRPDFLWDWSGTEEEHRRYRRLFRESDEAFHTANLVLAAVLANHLLSAADAFVAAHLGAQSPLRASAGWRSFPSGTAFEWRVELRR